MDSINEKITSRVGFSKAILVIRDKIVASRKVRSCLLIILSIVLEMSEVIAMGQ